VAFTSTLLDAGFEFRFYEKSTFSMGYRHLDYNGTIFREFLPGNAIAWNGSPAFNPGETGLALEADTWGGGYSFRFTPRVSMTLDYTAQLVQNPLVPRLNLENDEAFAKFLVKY
jgi:hypothetical protein